MNSTSYPTDTRLSAEERKELADLLYPDVTLTPADFDTKYPPRNLPEGAFVTRFAPSPTGFVHIGGIYASLISKTLAVQSSGVFYLRIEDTDQRREIAGGAEEIITALKDFGVPPMEGYVDVGTQAGEYGPYLQSQRKDIYAVYSKWLVEQGYAYPCFCSEEEIEAISVDQVKRDVKKKGYYGEWAKHRNFTVEQVKEELAKGKGFVLRVRAPEEPGVVRFKDMVRGNVEMERNAFDMVLVKSNGLPTYHFAHVVDDHLMRTTHVTRGEEWISTAPLHVQLFQMFGMQVPLFIHFSHIGKSEGSSVRKLSKRKDPEAAMSLYSEKGYPNLAVLEYLLNLANSSFDDWRRANPRLPYQEFRLDPRKLPKNIALFDQNKLDDISKDVISKMTAQEVFDAVQKWAKKYDPDFATKIEKNPEYIQSIFSIERSLERPRKDITNWSQVPQLIWYFFDEKFDAESTFELPSEVSADDAVQALRIFVDQYDEKDDKETWTEKSRSMAEQLGFARDLKSFKQSPQSFKGHIGNVMAVIRLAMTRQMNTPDLHQVMQVMGKDRVIQRLNAAIRVIEHRG